jgi:tetratricopeptide (TPR) repeat protein
LKNTFDRVLVTLLHHYYITRLRLLFSFLISAIFCHTLANPKLDSLQVALSNHQEEDSIKVNILNQLGYEYWIVNPIQSIIYGQQAKALAKAIGYEKGVAFSNRVVGVAHWARGSYDDGLKYLSESLADYKLLNDSLGQGNSLMNIGLIYSDRFDYDRALLYYFDALKIFEAVNARGRAATTYTKIASTFIDQNNVEASNDFLKRALIIHEENDFSYGIAEVYNRMGVLKFKEGLYDSSDLFLTKSLLISEEINDVEGKTKTLVDLAKISIEKKNYKNAEIHLQNALQTANEIGSYKLLKEIFEGLQLIYRSRGDLENALFFFDQYLQVKDSIFNNQMINNISNLESELATAEQRRQIETREQQIVILKQEADLQRIKTIALIIVVGAIFSLAFLITRNRRKTAKMNEERALEEVSNAKKQVEYKNRELLSYTVNFVQKNQLFEELISTIKEIKRKPSSNVNKDLLGIEKVVKRHLQVDRDWEDFKLRFENLHSGYFEKLLEQTRSLTNNDLKLSVLVKMNFSIKEIADMMGISSESVKTSRYRLKKKLKLPQDQNLNDFLNQIS